MPEMIHSSTTPISDVPLITAFSRTKTPVDRKIKQAGIMAKDIGQQASYGSPYQLAPSVSTAKSVNPTKKTLKRIEEQRQLRMDIKKYSPGLCPLPF
jgi:hypothetical protein